MKLINLSGGLLYHYIALKYKRNIWASFINQIDQQFSSIKVALNSHIILVGPSAGYSLPYSWLSNFDNISVVEPDPLARFLLSKKINFTHLGDDIFSMQKKINDYCSRHPGTVILFCNLLGQRITVDQNYKVKELLNSLNKQLCISYHDVYSVNTNLLNPRPISSHEDFINNISMLNSQDKLLINDHQTLGIFDNSFKKSYLTWKIKPNSTHLIELAVKDQLI